MGITRTSVVFCRFNCNQQAHMGSLTPWDNRLEVYDSIGQRCAIKGLPSNLDCREQERAIHLSSKQVVAIV